MRIRRSRPHHPLPRCRPPQHAGLAVSGVGGPCPDDAVRAPPGEVEAVIREGHVVTVQIAG